MIQDLQMIETFYAQFASTVTTVRAQLATPLTYAEKFLLYKF